MKKCLWGLVVLVLGCVFSQSAFAQIQTQTWARTYGGASSDTAYSIQQATDGGFVMAGWGVCAEPPSLSWEERLNYQEKIERVYYEHRTGEKLPFEEEMTREILEAKLRKTLRQVAVIEAKGGGGGVTGAMLQAELERICRSTKAPETLRELFAALDHNAFLAKEILVRSILAERMSRVLYREDAAFQAEGRAKAERMLEELLRMRGRQMEATARAWEGEYASMTFRTSPPLSSSPLRERQKAEKGSTMEVEPDVLARRYNKLKGTENAPRLRETEEAFIIERLAAPPGPLSLVFPLPTKEETEGERVESLEIESIFVHKRPYEEWLDEQVAELGSLGIGDATAILPATNSSTPQLLPASGGLNSSILELPLESLPSILPIDRPGMPDSWTATAVLNAPSARYCHTTVWTGTEMIVWGGAYGGKTGGRYNPATDTWTATTTTNAPLSRMYHTAVWTGTEMIVWGGAAFCIGSLNTGGRYNPATDTWTAMTTTNAPSTRRYHTAVWTGTEMVVWGGWSVLVNPPPTEYFNTGGRYNPATDTWTATTTTNVPSGRFDHTAVWTGMEMVVWGGVSWNYGCACHDHENTGGRYNPATDTWTATNVKNAAAGRTYHTAVWTGTEMIVWGGAGYRNTGGRYNPATDTWAATTTTDAPSGRCRNTAVWTGTEMIVWGGITWNSGGCDCFVHEHTGGRYNPATDTWAATTTTNAPLEHDYHTAVWTGTVMVVWGGYDGFDVMNTGGIYTPDCATPYLSYAASTVSDCGNYDGVIDQREKIELSVALENLGTADAYSVGGVLSTPTKGVDIVSDTVSFSDAPSSFTGTSLVPFVFHVSANVPCGTVIDLTLDLIYEDVSGVLSSSSVSFQLQVGEGGTPVCNPNCGCPPVSSGGDTDANGCTDGLDLMRLARSFGSGCGEGDFLDDADLDNSGWVDGGDLDTLVGGFGSGCGQ